MARETSGYDAVDVLRNEILKLKKASISRRSREFQKGSQIVAGIP
jgi:hypothetical protein